MTLETVYYITQIIAVGAILASLVAIYIQQRKDHALAKAENQREILMQVESLTAPPTAHPKALENIRACVMDYEGAKRAAQADFAHLVHKALSLAESALYMKKAKLINEASYVGFEGAAIIWLVTSGGKQYWQRMRMAFGADIRKTIDQALIERTDVPPVWEFLPMYAPDSEVPASTDDPEEEPDE